MSRIREIKTIGSEEREELQEREFVSDGLVGFLAFLAFLLIFFLI